MTVSKFVVLLQPCGNSVCSKTTKSRCRISHNNLSLRPGRIRMSLNARRAPIRYSVHAQFRHLWLQFMLLLLFTCYWLSNVYLFLLLFIINSHIIFNYLSVSISCGLKPLPFFKHILLVFLLWFFSSHPKKAFRLIRESKFLHTCFQFHSSVIKGSGDFFRLRDALTSLVHTIPTTPPLSTSISCNTKIILVSLSGIWTHRARRLI